MTSETCERMSGGKTDVALANLVRLTVILDALKLVSKIENHVDGSWPMNAGARKATAATVSSAIRGGNTNTGEAHG